MIIDMNNTINTAGTEDEFRTLWLTTNKAALERIEREKAAKVAEEDRAALEAAIERERQEIMQQAAREGWDDLYSENAISAHEDHAEQERADFEERIAEAEAGFDDYFAEVWTEWLSEHGDDLEADLAAWRTERMA